VNTKKNVASKKEIRCFLRRELTEYKRKIGHITPDEKEALNEWVATGNSVYDNPYGIYGEHGFAMDYIWAIRNYDELFGGPADFQDDLPASAEGRCGTPDISF